MKKLFVALLAVAGLTACFNEEVVNVADQRTPIAFDSFTDKVTRVDDANPSSTTANLTEFYVWGVMDDADGVVFDDERVYGGVGAWTYAQQQYWTPGHNYYFAAFAGDRSNDQIVFQYANAAKNGMSLEGLGTATFKNVAGINDFLYAEFAATTPAVIDSEDDVQVVNFAFDHLLSKVKFTFKNGFINDNITVLVKDVKMEVPAQGTIDLTADAYNWTNLEGTTILDMGDMAKGAKIAYNGTASSDNERLTIPAAASQVYTVTFYVESWQGDVRSTSATKVVEITNCVLEPGKAYNFVATLDHNNVAETPLFPIVFDCKVDEWDTEVEYDGGVIETKNAVADAASLKTAVANGGDIRLTENITLSGDELNVATGKNVNLDLNGKTLTVSALDPIKNNGKMTIANGKVVANYGENTRRCIYNYGEMTINGVEFVQTYDKKGAAINNEGKMTINDATVNAVFYSIWNSGDNAELIINGGTYTTTNNVDVRDEWAYAVICRNGAKMTIKGGSFVGNHGVIAAEGGEVVLNGGTYHCTATYTGNSDWTLYAADGGSISYDAAACTVTSANPSGAIYGNVTTF